MKLSLTAIAMSVVGMWACSSTSGPEFPDTASFCAGLAKAECAGVSSECGITVDTCTTQEEAACATAAAAAQSATRSYKADSAPACVNLAKTVYATNTILPATLKTLFDTCNRVYTGNVTALNACVSDYDCSGSLVCDKGFCANSVTKALGLPCGDPGEVCATGSYCTQPVGSTLQCVAKSSTTCSATQPCLESLHCVGGACTLRSSAGGSCITSDDCGSTAPYCDTYDGNICTSGQVFAPAEKAQCASFGWNQPYGNVAGATPVPVPDAGTGITVDSGATTDSAAD